MPDARSLFSRRDVLSSALGICWLPLAEQCFLAEFAEAAAQRKRSNSGLEPRNRFPRMMHEWLITQARKSERKNLQRRNALSTKADAEKYVQTVRKKIRQSFGPFPEKTPLKPRVSGVIQRDGYHIEKLIFESRPGFLVTANLYVPKGRTFPLPGVVGTCGHASNGKAAGAYQSFAQGLARQGYVVLIYDPIGQGERSQYVDDKLNNTIRFGTRQHMHAGNQQFLVGEFFGLWRAWDGIRALDYLLTRKEVDSRHIGVTGNSGGGTMTTWLCGLEQRWSMAAPSCFITTFRHNAENEFAPDTEQCPPKILAMGLDQNDFLAALAPKPVIILAKEKDYFDVRGTKEAYERLKQVYKLLGAEDNVGLFIGPTYHGYTQENREAMYRWFNQATGVSAAKKEPELQLEKEETLWCTPHGQVAELKSKTVFDFTRETAHALKDNRPSRNGQFLRRKLPVVLKLPRRAENSPPYRLHRHRGRSRQYPTRYFMTYAVETEPGIRAIVYRLSEDRLYSRPPRGKKRAVLYVSHQSADAELREEPLLRKLYEQEKQQAAFFTVDVRGVGESRPNTPSKDYGYAIHSLMLDRPYVGQRTHDVLRVLDFLKTAGHTEVHLVAKGEGTLPATFAAVLSNQVKQVTLKNALTSFQDVAETEDYTWPLSAFVPDVLTSFDLPDCYAVLKNKQLKHIEPWGSKQKPL